MKINIESMFMMFDEWKDSKERLEMFIARKPSLFPDYEARKKWEIEYFRMYESETCKYYAIQSLLEVFCSDKDQVARFFIAWRAWRSWYERTEWQYCASNKMLERLGDFIFRTSLSTQPWWHEKEIVMEYI